MPLLRITEPDREDTLARRRRRDRQAGRAPRRAAVGRVQHPRRLRAAGRNPRVGGPLTVTAVPLAANAPSSFSDSRPVAVDFAPGGAAVGCDVHLELAVDRVAEHDAVAGVPERHRIPEAFRVAVQSPLAASSRRRPRCARCARPGRGRRSSPALFGVDRMDVAEVELVGAGHAHRLPVRAVGGAQHRASRAAGPRHLALTTDRPRSSAVVPLAAGVHGCWAWAARPQTIEQAQGEQGCVAWSLSVIRN